MEESESSSDTTCQEVLGFKSSTHKELISAETLQKVDERREKRGGVNNSRTRTAKVKAHEEYTKANTSVKRGNGADKRNYIETLANEGGSGSLLEQN